MYVDAKLTKGRLWVTTRGEDHRRDVQSRTPPYVYYYQDPAGTHESIFGDKVNRAYFTNRRAFEESLTVKRSQGLKLFETDYNPTFRYLEETFKDDKLPPLHASFFDIEAEVIPGRGWPRPENPYGEITAVTLHHVWMDRTFTLMVPPKTHTVESLRVEFDQADHADGFGAMTEEHGYYVCQNERELLEIFLELIDDSDLLMGWNSSGYDLPYIIARIRMVYGREYPEQFLMETGNRDAPFAPNDASKSALLKLNVFPELPTMRMEEVANKFSKFKTLERRYYLHGRVHLDYKDMFQKFTLNTIGKLHSYKLDFVLRSQLNDKKLEYDGTLQQLYESNPRRYAAYNRQDTMGVARLDGKFRLVDLVNRLSHMAGVTMDKSLGSTTIIAHAIMKQVAHPRKLVRPDKPERITHEKNPGAFVVDPIGGIYDWPSSIDLKSEYPSCMRMLNLSPETMIGQFLPTLTSPVWNKHFHEYGGATNKDAGAKAWTHFTSVLEHEEILKRTTTPLTFQLLDGDEVTQTAAEWNDFLKESGYILSGNATVFSQDRRGIIAAAIDLWIDERFKTKKAASRIKNALKKETDPIRKAELEVEYTRLDTLQMAFKIFMNSAYGAAGSPHFVFYDPRLGKSVTLSGRVVTKHMIRQTCKEITGNYDFDRNALIYGDSVAGESEVVIDGGKRVPIASLFGRARDTRGEKEYDWPSCNILTYDEKTKSSCYRPIKYIMRHACKKKMFRVWWNNSSYIDVTEDHSLMGYLNTKNSGKAVPSIVKIRPEELGNRVNSIVYLKDVPNDSTETRGYSREVYEFLGYVVGDGSAGKINEGVRLSVGSEDIDEIERKLLRPLREQGLITSWHVKSNGHDVTICGTKIFRLVRDSLYENGIKMIPSWLSQMDRDSICAFLRGLFSADGTVSGTVVRLTTVREDIARAVRELMFLCGVSSTYFREAIPNSYNGICSGTYSRHIVVKSRIEFGERIGFIQKRKQDKIRMTPSRRKIHIQAMGIELVRVAKIEEISVPEYVYDIEVEDTHVFYANDVLVHNTDSVYFKLDWFIKEKLGLDPLTVERDMVIQLSDEIAKNVNATFPELLKESFFCNAENAKAMEAARDIVAVRGLFKSKKKKYALWAIQQEDTPTDQIKIVGMETRRTNTPKYMQEFLEGMIGRILRENLDYKSTYDIVQKFRDETFNLMEPWKYGSSMAVKNIGQVGSAWDEYESQTAAGYVGLKKPTSGFAVPAALNTNKLIAEHNEERWDQIREGDGVEVLYLLPNLSGYKTVALPVGTTYIPEWFKQLPFDTKRNQEKILDSALDNTVGQVLDWNFEPPQNNATEVFEQEDFFA